MASSKQYSEGYREKFMDMFPKLVKELTDEGLLDGEIKEAIVHLKEVCHLTIYLLLL